MNHIRALIRGSKTLLGPFPEFNTDNGGDCPYELFLEWFESAIQNGIYEPQAMTLSTIDCYGQPDARVLILKDVDEEGWYFASSSKSEKGKQIHENSAVSLTFYWPQIGRQIRIRGSAETMDLEKNKEDFLHRGITARAIALLDKQSSPLDDNQMLDHLLEEKLKWLKDNQQAIYPYWTVYRVRAQEVEFWQAHTDRKHVRLKFTRSNDQWVKKQLWP